MAEVVELHRRLLQATGGAPGLRDLGALESAIAQPTFLVLNGAEIDAPVGDQERIMFDLASGRSGRNQPAEWLRQRLRPLAW